MIGGVAAPIELSILHYKETFFSRPWTRFALREIRER
jgi:hypothetical protein